MSSFTPLPQHKEEPELGIGRVVLWVLLVGIALVPRIWIALFWIFSHQIGDAFSSWIVPAIGFCILPWTTLMYAWMWSIDSNGVNGWEWFVVGFAFLLDMFFWVAGRASLRS